MCVMSRQATRCTPYSFSHRYILIVVQQLDFVPKANRAFVLTISGVLVRGIQQQHCVPKANRAFALVISGVLVRCLIEPPSLSPSLPTLPKPKTFRD